LPFLGGHVDSFNVVYRQRLWDRAWQIIQQSPMLGDDAALLQMQDLRQGQGIIDLVNTYIGILLDNGFVGLSLFLAFILGPLIKVCRLSRMRFREDPDFGRLGAAIACSIVALLLMLENGSFGGGPERMFYVLAAFATGYRYLAAAGRSKNDMRQTAVAATGHRTKVVT
jgi:O-antigen ligase